MTALDKVKAIVLEGDPDAKHYFQTARGNYTTWHEYMRMPDTTDDVHYGEDEEDGDEARGGWRFQIDRFTKLEFDPVVDKIEAALTDHDNVSYSYQVDYEQDTGYIHHIFSCEAIF